MGENCVYDMPDPVIVTLRHRFYPDQKKTYRAECPLDAYLEYRQLREAWVVENMKYLNDSDRTIDF